MPAKSKKQKELNLFQMMKELNDQDKKLQESGIAVNEGNAKLVISNAMVTAKTHPGGGVVSMGVTGRTLMDIMTPGPTGKSSKICILCVIDKAAYDEYKKDNGFE